MRLNERASAATSSPPRLGRARRGVAGAERLRGVAAARAGAAAPGRSTNSAIPRRARDEQHRSPAVDQRRAVLAEDRVERPFARRQADDGDDAAVYPDARDAPTEDARSGRPPGGVSSLSALRAF